MNGIAAVTFDFHNTLVEADSWLQLEIDTLPGEVLARLVASGDLPPAAARAPLREQAEAAYRAIRAEAKASGREVTALAGVWRVLAALDLPPPPASAVEDAIAAAQRACLADSAPVPGAHAVLAALRAAGLRLAIVSSAAYPPFVAWGLARYDLARYFGVVATSGDTGYYKTDPRLYAWALDRLAVAPACAVHIGDHARFDVGGAQAAGLRAILFDRGAARGLDPDRAGIRPDAVITALAALPGALARLAAARD